MNTQTRASKDVTEAQGFLEQLQECWKKNFHLLKRPAVSSHISSLSEKYLNLCRFILNYFASDLLYGLV
jgi:hypothetical protein